MAHAMLQLLHEPQRVAAMRAVGCSMASQRYSLSAMVAAYAELYERELSR